MIKFVMHTAAVMAMIFFSLSTFAQKKDLTDEQYFKSNFKGITNQLPTVIKWLDDSHFILRRDNINYEIDCKTGAEKEYVEANINKGSVATTPDIITKGTDLYLRKNTADIQLTKDSAIEINATLSPDGKYVAYKKKNDLYTVNISTKKETRITKDGSETILNGYASWVYNEEILGRRSKYRSFWMRADHRRRRERLRHVPSHLVPSREPADVLTVCLSRLPRRPRPARQILSACVRQI